MSQDEIPNNCGTNCNGKCILTEVSGLNKSFECIANSTYYFCKESMMTFWIVMASFIALNIIAFIGAIINRGHKSDWCTFIVSIFQNVIIVSMIMGITCTFTISSELEYKLPIMLGLVIGVIMNVATFYVMEGSRSRKIIFKSFGVTADMDKVNEYIAKAHYNPPLIKKRYC